VKTFLAYISAGFDVLMNVCKTKLIFQFHVFAEHSVLFNATQVGFQPTHRWKAEHSDRPRSYTIGQGWNAWSRIVVQRDPSRRSAR